MKKCRKCEKSKPFTEFSPDKNSKDSHHSYCKTCIAKNRRERYKYDSKTINAINEKCKNELVKEINQIKTSLGCKFCPEKESICLDFHHTNSEEKEKGVSKLVMSRSRVKALEEIKKCICVCSNCHRKIHAGLINI